MNSHLQHSCALSLLIINSCREVIELGQRLLKSFSLMLISTCCIGAIVAESTLYGLYLLQYFLLKVKIMLVLNSFGCLPQRLIELGEIIIESRALRSGSVEFTNYTSMKTLFPSMRLQFLNNWFLFFLFDVLLVEGFFEHAPLLFKYFQFVFLWLSISCVYHGVFSLSAH